MLDRRVAQGVVGAERGGSVMAHTAAVDVGSHGEHKVCGGGLDVRQQCVPDCHRAFHVHDDRHVAAVHSGRRVALPPPPAHFCQTRSCCFSRRL